MSEQHTVPVIERMMQVLEQLEVDPRGVGIGSLVRNCGVPRSTVYRILNTLERHEMVRRDAEGRYLLGQRLARLAGHLPADGRWSDLLAVATPHLRGLARNMGETAKLSVLDGSDALCIGGAQGHGDFALNLLIGGRYPLHAGAASKVLLAAVSPADRQRIMRFGLESRTDQTITDMAALEDELTTVRECGWAEDRGEYALSVRAVAAPVRRAGHEVVAALSLAFLADAPTQRRLELRQAVTDVSRTISAELAG